MVDRRFSLALVFSLLLHVALMNSPGWRVPTEPEVETAPLEARLSIPKPTVVPAPSPAPVERSAPSSPPRAAPAPARRRAAPHPKPAPAAAVRTEPGIEPAPEPMAPLPAAESLSRPEPGEPATLPPVKLDASLPEDVFPSEGHIVFAGMRGAGGFSAANVGQQWQIEGERYQITMALNILFIRWEWRSEGRVTVNGLIPEVFRKERNGKVTDEVRFDWSAREVVSASGGRITRAPLIEGSQDALSIFYQLALFPPTESGTEIPIANGKTYRPRTFEVLGPELMTTQLGALRTAHLRLGKEGEDTIDLWLSLEHKNLPLRILWRQGDGITNDFVAVRVEYDDVRLEAPPPPPPHQG